MKKTILLAAVAALAGAAVSCNRGDTGEFESFGSLSISAAADPAVVYVSATRAANLDTKTYFLTVTSAGGQTAFSGTLPADGRIDGLPAGTYTATLRSMAAEPDAPAFDAPVYADTKSGVEVTSGGSTPVGFLCRQSNAGVRFVHDPSLAAAGLEGVVPTVTQDGRGLTYTGGDSDRTGYFAPGAASVTLTRAGEPLTAGGSASVSLTLAARQLWTVTLRADPLTGGAAIDAEVDAGTDDNDLAVTLDPPADGGGNPAGTLVFGEDFAGCNGPAYPVEGATFSASANFPPLWLNSAVTEAGLDVWTLTNISACAGGLKIGGSTAGGSATTPALAALGAGSATVAVTFRAANFEPEAGNIVVAVTGGGTVTSPAGGVVALPAGTPDGGTITASAAMKSYTVVIAGATSATRVVFSSAELSGAANRFFLDDVAVIKQ